MHVEVDGLAQLVAELLELARIEAGRLDLDLRVSCADQLVLDAIKRIRPYAARVGLDVHMGIIEPDLLVHADPRQIGQVLSNLLSNAVKFTPPGGWIELGARRDGSVVEIWVRDSGVGIAGHDLIRVFERFYKTDPSRTGTGTGLGLAICKHVVQAHGGWIYAESDGPGRGATFRFTLPAATSTEVEVGCVSNTNQWSTQPARPEAPQRPQSADDAAFRAVFEGYRAELELHCYRILGCGYNRNPMPSSRVSLTERRDRKPSMRRKKRCPWLSLRPRSTDSDHRSGRSRAQCSVSRANTADDFMYRAVSPDHPH
jgi:hypothetical protein